MRRASQQARYIDERETSGATDFDAGLQAFLEGGNPEELLRAAGLVINCNLPMDAGHAAAVSALTDDPYEIESYSDAAHAIRRWFAAAREPGKVKDLTFWPTGSRCGCSEGSPRCGRPRGGSRMLPQEPPRKDTERLRARRRPRRAIHRSRVAVLVAVRHPLPDVAVHVVEAEGVRLERADLGRALPILALGRAAVGVVAVEVGLIGGDGPPRRERRRRSGPAAYSHSASVSSR